MRFPDSFAVMLLSPSMAVFAKEAHCSPVEEKERATCSPHTW
jgi:hypothetical protein